MNTEQTELPELSDGRLDALEQRLMTRIGTERMRAAAPARSRRRTAWLATGAAAAVIVVAAVVGPSLAGGTSSGSTTFAEGAADTDTAPEADSPMSGSTVTEGGGDLGSVQEDVPTDEESSVRREVIATASATLEAPDAAAAADRIAALATDAGGYVESLSLQQTEADVDRVDDIAVEPSFGDAWVTVRIPAAELAGVTAALADVGEVRSSEIHRADVTAELVDLRARADALEASADRLRELMSEADSTADLLTAEDALAERQAELDSLRGQLAVLDDQVALSSLTVSLIEPTPTAAADPTGFGDGLGAGWNTLVATLNGIVIGLGFLLPWLVVAAVVASVVVFVVRAARRRRGRNESPDAE